MYNGNASSGFHTAGNEFKVIKTKSGHHLTFEEFKNITLSDNKGNQFHIDSKGNSINITALDTITINAKNININATENMNTNVGMNQTNSVSGASTETVAGMKNLTVGMDMFTDVTGAYNKLVRGDYNSTTEKDRNETGVNGVTYNSEEDLHIHSKKKINLNSSDKTTQF